MGAPRALALCLNFGGAVEFQAGNWREAESSLRDAVALYQAVGSASGESLSLQRLGVLLTARGQHEEARQCLDDGIVVAARAAMRSHCLTRLHASMIRNRLAAGDEPGIRRSLEEGKEAARRHGECVTCNALVLPEMIRAHIRLGQLDEANRALGQLERTATHFESQAWTAMACQAEARLLKARGLADEASAAFARAEEAFSDAGQPYEAARCRLGRAECCGEPSHADELRAGAARVFEELGSPGHEDLACATT